MHLHHVLQTLHLFLVFSLIKLQAQQFPLLLPSMWGGVLQQDLCITDSSFALPPKTSTWWMKVTSKVKTRLFSVWEKMSFVWEFYTLFEQNPWVRRVRVILEGEVLHLRIFTHQISSITWKQTWGRIEYLLKRGFQKMQRWTEQEAGINHHQQYSVLN